jgi:hypothetical protein
MEDNESFPVGSPVGQIEPPAPIGCHIQRSEPVGDKYRITCMALKRAGCSGLGGKGTMSREPRK